MAKKVKHALAYIILWLWLLLIVWAIVTSVWDWALKPLIAYGLAKALTSVLLLIGAGAVGYFMAKALQKLVNWLLKE